MREEQLLSEIEKLKVELASKDEEIATLKSRAPGKMIKGAMVLNAAFCIAVFALIIF